MRSQLIAAVRWTKPAMPALISRPSCACFWSIRWSAKWGGGLMAVVEPTRDEDSRAPISPVSILATPVRNLCFQTGLTTRAVSSCSRSDQEVRVN